MAIWQVIARVIEQDSRLYAVRMAQPHAACDALDITRGFDENDLYDNIRWLADNHGEIEKKLFSLRRKKQSQKYFSMK